MSLKRYKDFFDQESKEYLISLQKQLFLNEKEYFEKNYKGKINVDFHKFLRVDRAVGRASVTIPQNLFPQKIIDYLNEQAKEINKEATFDFATFVTYSPKYGDPQLVPHFDKPSSAPFILDYQIFANKIWPLVIEGEEEIMENNEAVLLNATTCVHWRKPDVFKDGEEVSMLFFSFHDPGFSPNDIYFDKFKMDMAYAIYEKQADEVYDGAMKLNYKKILGMW